MTEMSQKEEYLKKRKIGKKQLLLGGLFLLLCAAVGAGVFYFWRKTPEMPDRDGFPGGVELPEGIVAATGTTVTGLIEKELHFEFLDTDLMVDKVYVSSSDEVKKGDKVLKITDNTLKEATRELERAQMEAALACRQGQIDYEIGKLEAQKELAMRKLEAEAAQTVYDAAILEAEIDVQKARKALEDAQELLEEYTDAIENDYYYTKYEVEAKKAAYEKNVALFFEKLDDYGYELDDDDDDDPNTFNIEKKKDNKSKNNDGEETVLRLLKDEYQENKKEYDQAVKDYENATEKARAGVQEARDEVESRMLALQEAELSREQASVDAQAVYDNAVINGQKAQSSYEIQLKSLQEELDLLKDAMEEADENLELFQETIGDGCLYTETDGTILMIRAMENTDLATNGVLMAYSDANIIQVTASVSQADIAEITLGEQAAVVMEGYDTYTGVVSQINPISMSDSKASVTYNVTLDIEGDISRLSANITANVFFGLDKEGYEKLRRAAEKSRENREPDENAAPGGGQDDRERRDENAESATERGGRP